MTVVLHEVRNDLRTVKAQVIPSDEAGIPSCFETITTVDGLKEFDEKLSDKSVVSTVKKQLIHEVGISTVNTVTNVMKRLATKNVWKEYSLKGQRGKRSFEKLCRIHYLVKSFVTRHRKPPGITDPGQIVDFIDSAIGTFLCETKRRPRSSGGQGNGSVNENE